MDSSVEKQTDITVPREMAFLAWALLLSGVFVAFFILKELLRAYRDMDGNSFVGGLTAKFSDSTLMTFGEFPVSVTEQGATIVAYFVFIPIALLGIHVAIALIQAGTHILSPTFPNQISRLKQRINKLRDKMSESD